MPIFHHIFPYNRRKLRLYIFILPIGYSIVYGAILTVNTQAETDRLKYAPDLMSCNHNLSFLFGYYMKISI